MNNKELFYILMAGLGGYAAWLSIKNNRQQQAASDWLTAGAFGGGTYDFYGSPQPVDSVTAAIEKSNKMSADFFNLMGLS